MKFIYLDEVNSTNTYSKEHLGELEDRSIVYTYKQTNGHGRLNRCWECFGKGNIYASIVLKNGLNNPSVYSCLTQYLCVKLVEMFDEYGIKSSIKWPNDILVNGKKISGILAEASGFANNALEALILGFGVNLNCDKSFFKKINQPATSLNIELGKNVDCEKFLKDIVNNFFLGYDEFINIGFLSIKDEYIRNCGFLGKFVKVKTFKEEFNGIATDITDSGALKLVDREYKEKIIYMGDIL